MDFWALGCLIYFMLTGKEPFHARSSQDIIHNILNNDLEWDDSLEISEDAKDIVTKLLQLNPDMRLGAGKPESQNDIMNLVMHDWLTKHEWSKEPGPVDIMSLFNKDIALDDQVPLKYTVKALTKKLTKKYKIGNATVSKVVKSSSSQITKKDTGKQTTKSSV